MPSEYCRNVSITNIKVARCKPAWPKANNASGMPMLPAFMNKEGSANPRELKPKQKKYSRTSKPTVAKMTTMPPNKTAMSARWSGLLAKEPNTKEGVPRYTMISVTDARLILFQWANAKPTAISKKTGMTRERG